MGQLGLGPDITVRSRPARLNAQSLKYLGVTEDDIESFIIQICAGGIHTVCLNVNGDVLTCGCNDEGALGRKTSVDKEVKGSCINDNEENCSIVEESRLGYVTFPVKSNIIMVSFMFCRF